MKKGKKTPEEVKEAAKKLLEDPKKFDQTFERIFKKSDKNFDKKIDDFEYFNLTLFVSSKFFKLFSYIFF